MSIYVSMQITLDQIILFNPSSYNFKLTVAQIISLLYFIVCLRRGLWCLSLPFLCLETTFLTPRVCIYGLCMSVDVNVQRSGEDIGWSAILSLVPLRQVLSLTLALMFLVRWAASKAQWSSCLWCPHTGVTGTWEPCSPPPHIMGTWIRAQILMVAEQLLLSIGQSGQLLESMFLTVFHGKCDTALRRSFMSLERNNIVLVNSLHTVGLYAPKYRLRGEQRVFFWVDIVSIDTWVWWLPFLLQKEQINGAGHAITDVCPGFICTVQRAKCIIACYIGGVKYHNSLHCLIFQSCGFTNASFCRVAAWPPSSLEDNLNPKCFMKSEHPIMMVS